MVAYFAAPVSYTLDELWAKPPNPEDCSGCGLSIRAIAAFTMFILKEHLDGTPMWVITTGFGRTLGSRPLRSVFNIASPAIGVAGPSSRPSGMLARSSVAVRQARATVSLVVVRIGLSDSSSIDVPRDRRTPHAGATLVGCSMSKRMMGEGGEAGAPWRSAPADTRSSVSHADCS